MITGSTHVPGARSRFFQFMPPTRRDKRPMEHRQLEPYRRGQERAAVSGDGPHWAAAAASEAVGPSLVDSTEPPARKYAMYV
jgi:hypothetical protein